MRELKNFINRKRYVMFEEIDSDCEWEEEDLTEYELDEFDEDED